MASRGVNKVILIGNLGNDPEIRYFPNGDGVTNFSIATSESWKDRNTGEPQERTEWHRIVIRGKLAEIAKQYLRKGSKVFIEGKLRTRKWQGQDGQDRYTTEIVVDISGSMQMLDSRGSGDGGNYGDTWNNSSHSAAAGGGMTAGSPAYHSNDQYPNQPPNNPQPAPQNPSQENAAPTNNNPAGAPPIVDEPFDDDIPF